MSKHTPGPWVAIARTNAYISIEAPEQPGYVAKAVATVSMNNHEDNARLIAAAPDLLAVLQELEKSARYWGEYDVPLGIVDRISAAIAKATGEKA